MHGVQISTGHLRLLRHGPGRKQCLSKVTALCCLPGDILVAGGPEGRLLALDTARPRDGKAVLPVVADTRLPDGINSIAQHPSGATLSVGTKVGDLFSVTLDPQVPMSSAICRVTLDRSLPWDFNTFPRPKGKRFFETCTLVSAVMSVVCCGDERKMVPVCQGLGFQPELKQSGHCKAIQEILFPHNCSELLVTCSHEEIRVWDTRQWSELLRVRVPGVTCLSLALTQVSRRPSAVLQITAC